MTSGMSCGGSSKTSYSGLSEVETVHTSGARSGTAPMTRTTTSRTRRIVERRRQVYVFGVPRDLNASVRTLNAFSAHADKDELLWWARQSGQQVRRFFLVHGDPDQCEALAGHLNDQGQKAEVPTPGMRVNLLE